MWGKARLGLKPLWSGDAVHAAGIEGEKLPAGEVTLC
jgi:hypothetical protein